MIFIGDPIRIKILFHGVCGLFLISISVFFLINFLSNKEVLIFIDIV